MRINTFVSGLRDIESCASCAHVREVLIEPAAISKRGTTPIRDAVELAACARSRGLRSVLVWDLLMTDNAFRDCVSALTSFNFSQFEAVRVSDPGALQWLLDTRANIEIHFSCEMANKNRCAIEAWCAHIRERQGRLGRILLSLELTEDVLCAYCREMPVPFEYLGAGPIEIFYSARRLLSGEQLHTEDVLRHNRRVLRALQTGHGTLIYLDRDQFILGRANRLKEAGLHTLRIDLRDQSDMGLIAEYAAAAVEGSSAPAWPRRAQSPFFRVNKTTRQFQKLKPLLAKQRQAGAMAEIIAAERGVYSAFRLLRDSGLTGAFNILLPDGKEISLEEIRFRTRSGGAVVRGTAGDILIADWIPFMQRGALAFRTG